MQNINISHAEDANICQKLMHELTAKKRMTRFINVLPIQYTPSSPALVGSAVGWFGQPYGESHSLDEPPATGPNLLNGKYM